MSVLLDKRPNGVAVVTLNRPQALNALDVPAKERLGDIQGRGRQDRQAIHRQGRGGVHRGRAHLRIGIPEAGLHRRDRPGAEIRRQEGQRGGPGDGRLPGIEGQGGQEALGVEGAAAPGVERDGEVGARDPRPAPGRHGVGSPGRGATGVAARAGVGGAQGRGEIGPWHLERVVPPAVHPHVGAGGHVAGGAASPRRGGRVVMVRGGGRSGPGGGNRRRPRPPGPGGEGRGARGSPST